MDLKSDCQIRQAHLDGHRKRVPREAYQTFWSVMVSWLKRTGLLESSVSLNAEDNAKTPILIRTKEQLVPRRGCSVVYAGVCVFGRDCRRLERVNRLCSAMTTRARAGYL